RIETHHQIHDLVWIDSHRVLQAELVLVQGVGDAVVDPAADPNACAGRGVGDAAFRYLDCRALPAQHLKALQVHVNRMRVAGQVDDAPDLRNAEHGEEIGLVL